MRLEAAIHRNQKPLKEEGFREEILSILKRAKTEFVGVLEPIGQIFFLNADDRKMYIDIFISKENSLTPLSAKKSLPQSFRERSKKSLRESVKVIGKLEARCGNAVHRVEKGFVPFSR